MSTTDYDYIYDAIEDLRASIMEQTEPVEAAAVGLDPRCQAIFIGKDFVMSLFPKALDYYGGFEYIDEGVMTIGEMKIYFAEGNDRVQRILDNFYN